MDIVLIISTSWGESRGWRWYRTRRGIIPALLANKYDAIVASFTDKYYSNQARFVAGKNIGAQRATIAASWLEENAGGAQVKLYDTHENVFLPIGATPSAPGLRQRSDPAAGAVLVDRWLTRAVNTMVFTARIAENTCAEMALLA